MQSLEAIVHWNIVPILRAYIKNHFKFDNALLSEKINSCTFLADNYVVAQSLIDFAQFIKSQKVNDVLCYVGFDGDLKTMSNPMVYQDKGFLYLALVYENHSSFWKITGAHGEDLLSIRYQYIGKVDIVLTAIKANIDALKQDTLELYKDALEQYKAMPENLFFEDSKKYIQQCFKDALEHIQATPGTSDSAFWYPELMDKDAYQILSSLRNIPLVHRMGSFLDMHSTIANAHGKLYNEQNLILQQCINS
ncbi:MAG TPA: hypothetical protein PKC21_06545 [Oligoflexia bacterium]|nr:hypothetical protein [Oligoflexia bacterium]HMR24994.1 hypothetical protein [Oligoflexia bacterium]